jgi:hypothetical protein
LKHLIKVFKSKNTRLARERAEMKHLVKALVLKKQTHLLAKLLSDYDFEFYILANPEVLFDEKNKSETFLTSKATSDPNLLKLQQAIQKSKFKFSISDLTGYRKYTRTTFKGGEYILLIYAAIFVRITVEPPKDMVNDPDRLFAFRKEWLDELFDFFAKYKIPNKTQVKVDKDYPDFRFNEAIDNFYDIKGMPFEEFDREENKGKKKEKGILDPNKYKEIKKYLKAKTKLNFKVLAELSSLIQTWIDEANYRNADTLGKKIAEYYQYIPDEFKKAPSKLYRGTHVSSDDLKNFSSKQEEEYSSWTTHSRNAADAASGSESGFVENVPVVIKKTFSPSDIFLNIDKFVAFLENLRNYVESNEDDPKFKDLFFAPIDASEEGEVIVKNAYWEMPNNLYSYEDPERGGWRKKR